MAPDDVPVLGPVLAAGADDRVFDAFLLLGPVVLALVALLGRNAITTAVVAAYVLGFTCYVAAKGVRARAERNT